ncbi:MAG: PAS domain S-box protein [Actinobacteria bacterium]|nr:PAS domain S-box protein [Actinomycetota bacterium]
MATYVTLLSVVGAVVVGGGAAFAGWRWPSWIALVLASFAFLTARVPLRFQRRGGAQAHTIDEAVVVGLLWTAPLGVVPALMALAVSVAHVALRHDRIKIAYNAASTGISTFAAAVAFSAVTSGQPFDTLRGVLGTVVAAGVYNAVGLALLAVLFTRLQGSTFRGFVRDSAGVNGVTWLANVALGILMVVVALHEPWALAAVLLVGIGLHLGFRGYVAAVDDRRRMRGMLELTRTLADFTAGPSAFDRFLEQVAAAHQARGAALRLWVDGEEELHVWGTTSEEVAPVLSRATTGIEAFRLDLESDGMAALAAPLVHKGEVAGSLAVVHRYGVEPWTDDALTLISALATEVAVTAHNIELFKQVERERARWAEESTKLNDILGAASDGIAMLDASGEIVSWNPGMSALTGVEAGHALNKPWWTVLRVRDLEGDDLLPEGDHVVTSALAGDRHGDPVSVQVLRRDGQWRWVRATFSPLLSEDGDIDGTVMVARDVTAEREVEELKADFVATVSHELRTPLTPLKGFLATVRQRSDLLTPDQIAMLHESMESQVLRLERLVNDLLVVADLDRGRVRFGRELVGLHDAVELASAEEQDHGEDRVRIVGDRRLAAAADGNAVVRIVRALISNALKHSDGLVRVELAREGHEVTVRVADEGPGIPPWEQERIFQRFHRLGDHLHRTQGPGLGLSIAKALTDHLGGTIEVDSDVGRGATFVLRLRAAGPVPVSEPSSADVG